MSGELSDLAARCLLPPRAPRPTPPWGPIKLWPPLPPFLIEEQRAECPPGDRSPCRVRSSPAPSRGVTDLPALQVCDPSSRPPPQVGADAAAATRRQPRGGRAGGRAGRRRARRPFTRQQREPRPQGRPFRPRAAEAWHAAGARPGGRQTRRQEES